jgi:type IV pilus assembly protein PilN
MRFEINLASQPYENLRRFYRQWGLTLLLVGVVAASLVATATYNWNAGREVRTQLGELQREIARLEAQKREAETLISRPEHNDLRQRSRFLNELIARKTFSWTKVFSELEGLIPARVRVTSIRPELTQDNQLGIVLMVSGDSRTGILDLVSRMEASNTFRETRVRSETASQRELQFEISALYLPTLTGGPL